MPKLSIMMFLQFFIWGSWYVTAPRVLGPLGFDAEDFGWTYSVGPIAGMISPFFVGMIADRFFATQRVLAVMHFAGAAMMGLAIMMMGSDQPSPNLINVLFFGHMLCYYPTIALTNTLALHRLDDAEKQFPRIRVFGTIGWIAAGWSLTFFAWGQSIEMFYLAAGSGVLLGVFSLTLPHTPPPAAGKPFSMREALGLDAFVLLKNPSFLVFMLSSFLICIPLAFYYQFAERTLGAGGIEDTPMKMSFGQVSEILFMIVMPYFFARLGVKWMLAVGMFAWVLRYALFSFAMPEGNEAMLMIGVILHGICYDFFFVTGQIYTDKVAPAHIRGQAQGMLILFTLGLGMFIGAQVASRIEAAYTPPAVKELNDKAGEVGKQIDALTEQLVTADEATSISIQAQVVELTAQKNTYSLEALQAIDWSAIYIVPCLGALAIMILFLLFFRQRKDEDGEDQSAS